MSVATAYIISIMYVMQHEIRHQANVCSIHGSLIYRFEEISAMKDAEFLAGGATQNAMKVAQVSPKELNVQSFPFSNHNTDCRVSQQ